MLGTKDFVMGKNKHGCCPPGDYSLVEMRVINELHILSLTQTDVTSHQGLSLGREKAWCYDETEFDFGSFGKVSLVKWGLSWEPKRVELIGKEGKKEEDCRHREEQVQKFLTRQSLVITRYWEEACVALGKRITGTELSLGRWEVSVPGRPCRLW